MLVVVTIISIGLGRYVDRVRQRRAALDWIDQHGGSSCTQISYTVCWPILPPFESAAYRIQYAWDQVSEFVGRQCGDRAISDITLPDDLPLTDAEVDQIQSLFPGATVEWRWEQLARERAHPFSWVRAPAVSRDCDEN